MGLLFHEYWSRLSILDARSHFNIHALFWRTLENVLPILFTNTQTQLSSILYRIFECTELSLIFVLKQR